VKNQDAASLPPTIIDDPTGLVGVRKGIGEHFVKCEAKRNPPSITFVKKLHQSIIAAIALISLGSGCATGPALSATNAKSLGPVACSLDPDGRHQPKYESVTAKALGALGGFVPGLVPGLIAAGVTSAMSGFSLGAGQAELDTMSQSLGAFEGPKIIKTVETRLKFAGYNTQPSAPTAFTVKLYTYGLIQGRKELVYGKVTGRAVLTDSAHQELWRGEAAGFSSTGHTMDEYMNNPELYREALRQAANSFAWALYNTRNKTTLPEH
jgi:hypothetical protein